MPYSTPLTSQVLSKADEAGSALAGSVVYNSLEDTGDPVYNNAADPAASSSASPPEYATMAPRLAGPVYDALDSSAARPGPQSTDYDKLARLGGAAPGPAGGPVYEGYQYETGAALAAASGADSSTTQMARKGSVYAGFGGGAGDVGGTNDIDL